MSNTKLNFFEFSYQKFHVPIIYPPYSAVSTASPTPAFSAPSAVTRPRRQISLAPSATPHLRLIITTLIGLAPSSDIVWEYDYRFLFALSIYFY